MRILYEERIYALREEGEYKFDKILSLDDIGDKLAQAGNKKRVNPKSWRHGKWGTFYLGYYFAHVYPEIQRVSADGKTVEDYASNLMGKKSGKSGQEGAGWSGSGSRLALWPVAVQHQVDRRVVPPGVIIGHAHHESGLRRFVNGRVSTAYGDGEWREAPGIEGEQLSGFVMFV